MPYGCSDRAHPVSRDLILIWTLRRSFMGVRQLMSCSVFGVSWNNWRVCPLTS